MLNRHDQHGPDRGEHRAESEYLRIDLVNGHPKRLSGITIEQRRSHHQPDLRWSEPHFKANSSSPATAMTNNL